MKPVEPTAAGFKEPVITLKSYEVLHYDGYWYYSRGIQPSKGSAGDHGAPLLISFLFGIENPNPYPILLQGVTFELVFDRVFTVGKVNNQDSYWVPEMKKGTIRVTTLLTVRSSLLGLMNTNASELGERRLSPWRLLEKWWTGLPQKSIPVGIRDGVFTIKAGTVTRAIKTEADLSS